MDTLKKKMGNVLFIFRALFLVLLLSSTFSMKSDDNLLFEALKKSDFLRGGVEGISWSLMVENIEEGKQKDRITLLVEATVTEEHFYSLVSFLTPQKFEGQKLLMRDNNMWFIKTGLRGPVPISGRQRLTGRAANADVASANYHKDYMIASTDQGSLDGVECYIFNLQAKNNLVNYPQIKYWVSKAQHQGLQAEFYGKSNKLIKSAAFEYKNPVSYKSGKYDYISKITIYDNINREDRTILNIMDIKFPTFDHAKFQKDRLLD